MKSHFSIQSGSKLPSLQRNIVAGLFFSHLCLPTVVGLDEVFVLFPVATLRFSSKEINHLFPV